MMIYCILDLLGLPHNAMHSPSYIVSLQNKALHVYKEPTNEKYEF